MMDKGVTLLVHIYKSKGYFKSCTSYSNEIMGNNWEKAKTRIKYVGESIWIYAREADYRSYTLIKWLVERYKYGTPMLPESIKISICR